MRTFRNHCPEVLALGVPVRREVAEMTLDDGVSVTVVAPASTPAAHRALVVYVRSSDNDDNDNTAPAVAVLLRGTRYGAGVYPCRAKRLDGARGPGQGAWSYAVSDVGREVAAALTLIIPDAPRRTL